MVLNCGGFVSATRQSVFPRCNINQGSRSLFIRQPGLRSSFLDLPSNLRRGVALSSSNNGYEDEWKFEVPPFKINDKSALLVEIGLIIISQLLVALYKAVDSPLFPGWDAPITVETFTSPSFIHAILVTVGLPLFWVISRWWSRSLEYDISFYRLEDAFDATWQQWIAVANLYISTSLIISSFNHIGVTGIEAPLLSGAIAILVARVLYYGIPLWNQFCTEDVRWSIIANINHALHQARPHFAAATDNTTGDKTITSAHCLQQNKIQSTANAATIAELKRNPAIQKFTAILFLSTKMCVYWKVFLVWSSTMADENNDLTIILNRTHIHP